MGGSEGHLEELLGALKSIERSAGQFDRIPAAFDRELERVRKELTLATEKLGGVRLRIRALTDTSEADRKHREEGYGIDRFLGRLEQALTQFDQLAEDGELVTEVDRLRAEIDVLAQEVREEDVARRRQFAVRTVSSYAQALLPGLDVENADHLLSLSIDDLSVKISGPDRDSFLWEIGSGSNWLAYHLAVVLALHQFFLRQAQSPVPSFVVFDQPSQVYFPKKLADAAEKDEHGEAPDREYEKDEDVEAVRKAFRLLSDVVGGADGRLQVIALDHAAGTVWGGIGGLNPVVDWRNGRKLVPVEWTTSQS